MISQKNAFIDVNPVILSSDEKIVLAKRKNGLVEGGRWHLPGGMVQYLETFQATLKRVAFFKTNLRIELFFPSLMKSLVGIYDDPNRDPREHVVSLAFLCKIVDGKFKPGANVELVEAFSKAQVEELEIAFDHKKSIYDTFDKLEVTQTIQ
jgi:8-oxo-dGTP diphosphatase